jgi:hypothetical protein
MEGSLWQYNQFSFLFFFLGIPERIDYAPGSSRQELFPESTLELCDLPCGINTIETKLQLSTVHIGKGCDRDTYGVHSQRKLCGKKHVSSLFLEEWWRAGE